MANTIKTKQQVKARLKKGDEVVVLTGKSRGETGSVERVDRKHDRVFVTGVNIGRRHTKPSLQNQEGGIVEKNMPLHISNVAVVEPKTKKASRIGYEVQDGQKVRITRRSKARLA